MNTLKSHLEVVEAAPALQGRPAPEPELTAAEVDAQAIRTGQNRHVIIAEHRLRHGPVDALPSVARAARERLDEVAAAQVEADRQFQAALRTDAQHKIKIAALAQLRADLAAGQEQLAATGAVIADVLIRLENWPSLALDPRGSLSATLDVLARSKCFVEFLPGWITAQKAKVKKAEADLAEFEREHGIAQVGTN